VKRKSSTSGTRNLLVCATISRVFTDDLMVGLGGLEPLTSPLSDGALACHVNMQQLYCLAMLLSVNVKLHNANEFDGLPVHHHWLKLPVL
jgi:hypothetical protein